MQADPVMGPNLLDPPKSPGVLEMDDSAMIIRAKFMAKPGEQFVIRREPFQRVQQEFEAAGIQFARRQVSAYVPSAGPPVRSLMRRRPPPLSPPPSSRRKPLKRAAS
jgi:small-conductance mechanosensitive channel